VQLRMGHLIVFFAACFAQAQAPDALRDVHPSNGVMEMSAVPVVAPDRHPPSQVHEVFSPWRGLAVITIRNVSQGVVTFYDLGAESDFHAEVVGSNGEAVARTEFGKRVADPNWELTGTFVSVHQTRLAPLEETTIKMNIAKVFQIEPGHAYTVTLRRFRGLPKTNEAGKPLQQIEIGCSFEVPEYGILREQ
jgi:hypothetical protein